MSSSETTRARGALALVPAAVLGIVLGVLGSGEAPEEAPAPTGTVVARVGEVVLLEAEVDEALRAAGQDPASAPAEERAAALQTLVDDELWFQAAMEAGLLQTHRGARDAVVRRMLDVIFPAGEVFDAAALQGLYDETYAEVEDPPPFDKVRFRLEEEQRRRRNARALEDYLAWLRSTVEVESLAGESELQQALEAAPSSEEAR